MNLRLRARRVPWRAVALLVMAAAAGACSHETPAAIQLHETEIIVQNQTPAQWSNVEIWVNDHFRGLAPTLLPDQRLVVPLDSLVAAFGQRFDRHRQPVFGILVTAKASDGQNVRLMWGKVRRR